MKKLLLLVVTSLIMFSCTSQNVAIDYDRSINFNQFKTYSFGETSTGVSELDNARIEQALKQQLSLKTLHYTENNGDLTVFVSPKEYISTKSNSSVGLGVGSGGRGFGGGLSVGIPIQTKQLNQEFTVSMYRQNALVWEGVLTIRSGVNTSPESKDTQIRKGVEKLLRNYPPSRLK